MKNNFQSNGKGRNQRVWQLLISMLIILTMGIGQMWGASTTLFNVDFSAQATEDITTSSSSAVWVAKTYSGYNMSMGIKSGKPIKVIDDGLEFTSNNFNTYTCLAIPLTGVSTEKITVTITLASSGKVKYAWASGNLPDAPTVSSASAYGTAGTTNTLEYTPASAGNYVLYLGRNGASDGKVIKSILITQAVSGYSVTYVENGHGANQTDLTGQTALPNPLPTLSESGWDFGGWFTDNGTFETAAVAGAALSANATLYAKWTAASVTPVCPAGISISGTAAYTEGQTISLNAALSEGNGDITYTWYKGADLTAAKAAGSIGTGASFSKASCATSDAGKYWCVATKDACDEAANSYAVTVDAISYCTELVPATSGDVPAAGGAISLTTATGGSMKALTANISYSANGLLFGDNSGTKAEVTLTHLMQVGTIITATIYNGNDDKARGLNLLNSSGTSKATWTKTKVGDHIETYTVVAGDGLAGSNVFQLQRNQNAYLKDLKVSNCGAELHALTSAIDPVAADGKATITLSKTLVATGATATATYSDIDAAYDFDEWVVSGATIDDAKANPVTITMGSTDATITLKLKAAAVKYTVHFDSKGGSLVANQSIDAGGHAAVPTAPTKFKYTFGGWSETDGGSTPANLAEIAINAEKTFYAIWTPKACPTSGEIYSLVADPTKAPGSNTYYPTTKPGVADLAIYATVSGGLAQSIQTTSSNNSVQIQSSTAAMKITADNSIVRALLECPLQEGDTIKLVKDNKLKITFDSVATSAKTIQLASGTGANKDYYVVAAGFAGEDTIHVRKDGSNVTVTSVKVIRPAKFAVTFNMHDHGDAVTAQNIIKGGKVSEPATTDITGWDFGGWYKESTYDNEWDFDNDVVEAATELHAKWTAHVANNDVALGTLSVNGEAITIVPSQTVYAVELPMGTSDIPTVVATANDVNAKACTVTQATAVDGSASIYVKAEDDATEATYTINFSLATSKDLELVWDKTKQRCDATTPAAVVKSDDATVSTYINKMTFTGGGEGSSLNVGNTAGNMFTLSAKAGYAFQAMSFFGKIQDATCEYSLDGGAWTELASTKTDGDKCYANIFSAAEVHEFRLRSTGTSGVWIRNMQLTIVEACTPIVLAWDEEPVEFEVGKSGYAIAATANNSGAVTYSSTDGDVIAVNGSTGALTVSALGSVTLKAATAEGDGTAYCANSGNDIEISKAVNTYYLVTFDGQNGEAVNEVKYYSGDAAIALPAAPSYSGFDFQGWFDAEAGGNKYLAAITPAASMTVYAQWQAQCDGATITTQPTGASYLTGRTATALICEATAGNGGALTYEWFTCDDELKTNPVAATATPSTAVAGTFYYFCKVTEAGCGVEAFSNVVTITVADKDAICIIKSTPTSGTEATVDGVYQGNAYFKGKADSKKLNSGYDYVGVELSAGHTFLATDRVVLNQTANLSSGDITKFYIFTEEPADGKTYVTVNNDSPVKGDNWFTMPAEMEGESAFYIGRVDNKCNPSVGYLAVYRACAPILSKITVNGVEGTPNNTNHVTIEVPASTTQTQLEAIAYEWVSNNDAWTAAHDPAAANAWEFDVENTVTFTDKDGDASEYYITVNKAAASSDATLSALTVNGQAVALVDGVYAYDVELPYGTTAVPTVVATAHHAGAVATVDPCTLSGATITVVPESGAGDQQIYTLTFTVAAWEEIIIWDGSYMTALATSPTSETELRWATTGFGSIDSYNTTYGEKSYSKYLPSGGASTGRYMTLTVPAGYVAKFYIVMATHSDTKERGMFIGSNLVKDPDETSVLELSNNDRDVAVAGMSEIVGAGTWYINPNNSIDFQEIRAYLRKGYKRSVSNNIGTLCVNHNVAAADLFGATFYQIAGKEPEYGKIVFDEVTELEAGEPYIFQSTTGSILMFYGETVAPDPVAVKGMIGSYVSTTLSITEANKADIMYISSNKLWNCEDLVGVGLQVVANRCYIDYSQVPPVSSPNPAPGRKRVVIGGAPQVATGNENINASETPVKVMIDGQMYILRGEKMYDTTGRLVK